MKKLALITVFLWCAWTATASAAPLLRLQHAVVARSEPSPQAPVVERVPGRSALTGERLTLPIVRETRGRSGGRWLEVRLPSRPNGATGWVPKYSGRPASTRWQIVVHLAQRRAVVTNAVVRRSYPVVVGAPATPTPTGTFFVVEKAYVGPGVTEGPWALGTSAFSNVLQQFGGGPGQVALHGVTGLPDPLGTAASHGCVRFANSAITWIAEHVPVGTPIRITR